MIFLHDSHVFKYYIYQDYLLHLLWIEHLEYVVALYNSDYQID